MSAPARGRGAAVFKSDVAAGTLSGELSVIRAEPPDSLFDAEGAAMCGIAADGGLLGEARLYAARGADGTERRRLVLPGAGGDGRSAVIDFSGARTADSAPLPAAMPDFGLGMPEWSAEIKKTSSAYAVFGGGPEAFRRVKETYLSLGWSETAGGGEGFAIFARGADVAVVSAGADGVSVLQRVK